MFTLVRSVYNLNITNIFGGGHHSWLITDNMIPERDDVDSPSALCSPSITPVRSPQFSPRGGKDNSTTELGKVTMNESSRMLSKSATKPLITQSMKFTLDMLAEKIMANKTLLQIAYTDLKMSHRFVRFSINPNGKFKDLTHKQLNQVIADYLSGDSNVVLFRLQDDNDVSNFKNNAMDNMFKDLKTNFKIIESGKKNSYSLTIIYDIMKNREINELRENLEANNKIKRTEKKYLCKDG
jgi:hypothetical protein